MVAGRERPFEFVRRWRASWLIGIVAVVLAARGSTASAALIIDVQDATLIAGSTGFVDVLIRSDAGVTIDLANYDFEITAIGQTSALQFLDPQTLDEPSLPNYLFYNDSWIDVYDLTPSRLIGGDLSDSGNGTPMPVGENRLLVRLEIRHELGQGQTPQTTITDMFRITLQNTDATFFEDLDGNVIPIDASSFDPAGVGGGTISIQAAAVPEPGSFALMGSALLASYCGMRFRRVRTNKSIV